MLTGEERAAVAGWGPAGAIDALRLVQRRRGWVSDEVLKALAGELGMSAAALDEVATFYNLIFRMKVGRHVILLCDSATCWMMGRDGLETRICERLGVGVGEVSADGRFTLLPIVCLGACDRAPVMMVGDELHGDLDAARLDDVLAGVG